MRDEWDRREERSRRWRRLGAFLGVVVVAFVVTLGLVVGNRLSDEALGVLAGAVCGVGAAIPTSLIVVAVTRRREGSDSRGAPGRSPGDWPRPNPYPPVVVVSPPAGQQRSPHTWNALPPSLSAPIERNFTVVGGASAGRKGVRYDDERRS
jgi:drug/metabolite transporter (DMT)-like permease